VFDAKTQAIVDVPLNEFLADWTPSRQRLSRLVRVSVEFPERPWDRSGFTVEPLGRGEYNGFMLDGDGRFLLRDGTVTHNSEIACAVTKNLALPTLFLVERLELLHQIRARYAKRLGIPETEIGIIGDTSFQMRQWINAATPASLKNKLQDPEVVEMLNRTELLFFDECHHVASDTFFTVAEACPAYYRFGLSGTPLDRGDGADMRLIAQTGPVLYNVPNKILVERGISVPPHVEMVKITQPHLPARGLTYGQVEKLGVVQNETLNEAVITKALEHAADGKQILILVEKIEHGKTLRDLLKDASEVAHRFLSGKESTDKRRAGLESFKAGETRILIATTILDEGVDVPNIDVLILAGGGKAKIRLLQRVGRGLRRGEGKVRLLVIDFANFTHKWLLKHSLSRLQTYKSEECFVISAA